MESVTTLIEDYTVVEDSHVVDFTVEMLCEGSISVNARAVIELEQETYHCYFRQLDEAELPIAPDELCERLERGLLPPIDEDTLKAASAPIRTGSYDVLLTTLPVSHRIHQGIRVRCPSTYSTYDSDGNLKKDEHGVLVSTPPGLSQPGYGGNVAQPLPGELYQGDLGDIRLLLIPLVNRQRLNLDRVEYYEGRLRAGERPTILAVGFHANERCMVLAILDGHHKLAAAAQAAQPVSLLAFISPQLILNYGEGMSLVQNPEQLDVIRKKLREIASI